MSCSTNKPKAKLIVSRDDNRDILTLQIEHFQMKMKKII